MDMSADELAMSGEYEEDIQLGREEVEDLPNFDMYESDGGESLSDGNLSLSDDEEQEREDVTAKEEKVSKSEQVRLIHLRRWIDELAENVKEKEYEVAKTRAEKKECKARLEQLEREWKLVNHDREQAQTSGNIPAEDRLCAQLRRVQQEIENEEILQEQIKQNLSAAEYDLALTQVEEGKMLLAEDDLKKRETRVLQDKKEIAKNRETQEKKYAMNALKQREASHRLYQSALREQRKKEQEHYNSAQKSHEKHSKYLQKTITEMRQRSAEESARSAAHVEKRMNTMLSLKGTIAQTKDSLRARHNRDRARAQASARAEEQLRQGILDAGGNPDDEILKREAMERYKKEKEAFATKQRENEVKIAERILKEEKVIAQKKKQHPQLFATDKSEAEKIVAPHPKPTVKLFEQISAEKREASLPKIDMAKFELGDSDSDHEAEAAVAAAPHASSIAAFKPVVSREATDMSHPAGAGDAEEIDEPVGAILGSGELAKPEFEGLWDQHKPYKVPKAEEHTGPKMPGASKMDREIMDKVLNKHREGIVIEQVAGGKKFTGCPFYSKPKIIHFKDFEVGKTYKKKVVLTNVSYTVNYLKLIGLTEHLKDFIDVLFDPPGQMSAGLTCEMLVTFKPMINEDLVGEVDFLAQTGPFSVPLHCTTKKCDLKVDTDKLDFGVSVIGETLTRSFTLSNKGALPTTFTFYKVTAMKQRSTSTATTSLGRLTSVGSMRNVSPDSDVKLSKSKKSLEDVSEKKGEEKAETEGTEKAEDGEEGTERQKVEDMIDDEESELAVDELEELMSLDGMSVGAVSHGEIGAFASVRLEVIWKPTTPGRTDTDFMLAFDDPDSPNIGIRALASAIDVPVWVERETVDLNICMYDRLYQDSLIIHNRANTALRLTFDVAKELRHHMQVLPREGYIQAQSTFSAQLMFKPLKSLPKEASKYFNAETRALEAPVVITVADQTRPVPFTVLAVVTSTDLQFDTTDIDFGHATIYESAYKTIKLTNYSILPQQFGFVNIPNYVDIQPNDGFGTILPLETIELFVIFQPKKADDYEFTLTMKSLINREFTIKCVGVGVHPPLELSHQVLHLQATALNDITRAAIQVINSHVNSDQYSHAVPRIGKEGTIAPVGPTSFEFIVPKDSPISISPSVGTVKPGQRQNVWVRYNPQLVDSEIRREAVRMITKKEEAEAAEEWRQFQIKKREEEAAVAASKKKPPPKGKQSPKGRTKPGEKENNTALTGPRTVIPPEEDSITKDSDAYAAAQASLMRNFQNRFETVRVPCHIASGKCGKPGTLQYSEHNTMYLEVHCPAVKPEVVVISDSGRVTADFGDVSIGMSVTRSITVQNIADYDIEQKCSCLNTTGPFNILNALRTIQPDSSHTILISFIPTQGEVFQEVLELRFPKSSLFLTLKGCGVTPLISLSMDDSLYDMGGVLAGEYREDTFKISNTSSLAVEYSIKLDSQSLLRYGKAQALPGFVLGENNKNNEKGDGTRKGWRPLVGVQNKSGAQVFDCTPPEGIIPAGGIAEVTITFAPDHPSDHFSDGVRVELFGQEEQHVFKVIGQAKPHIMYMGGGDPLTPAIESLAVLPPEEIEEDAKPPPIPILVNLRSVSKETEFSTATTEIFVGCVRTMAVSQKKGGSSGKKKNGEYFFDNVAPLAQLGFTFEPLKGMVEAGSKKPVIVTWNPPPGFDPNQPLEVSVNCTLKGDVTEVYKLLLRAYVVTEE